MAFGNVNVGGGSSGGGGGSGKMVQQLELPMSNIYEENTSEAAWDTMDVSGQPAMTRSVVENGVIYAVQSVPLVTLYKQNYATKQITIVTLTANPPAGETLGYTLRYNGGTYFTTQKVGSGQSPASADYYLYKINEVTKTYTKIILLCRDTNATITPGIQYKYNVYMINEKLLVVYSNCTFEPTSARWYSRLGWVSYSMATNILSAETTLTPSTSQIFVQQNYLMLQKNSENTAFRIMITYGVTNGNNKSNVFAYVVQIDKNVSSFGFVSNFGQTLKPIENNTTEAVQVGEKMIYVTYPTLLGGKKTGEIDLFNLTINTVKYPEIPVMFNFGNMQKIGDDIVLQSTGKTYSLKIIPVPPQNKPLVMKLFKGDKYSAPFIDKALIDVLSITSPSQPAFTITTKQQTAAQDLEIHMGQYDLQGTPTQILIEKP